MTKLIASPRSSANTADGFVSFVGTTVGNHSACSRLAFTLQGDGKQPRYKMRRSHPLAFRYNGKKRKKRETKEKKEKH